MATKRLTAIIEMRDNFSNKMEKILNSLNKAKSGTQKASQEMTKFETAMNRAGSSMSRLNPASAISGFKGLALSIAGVVGVSKLLDETVGRSMDWEVQAMSMDHWLKGNKEKSAEAMKWIQDYANLTPYETQDVFPSYTRALGISDNDTRVAGRLTKLAGDMAALTPGKTIKDAMEALADANMGEFERLKEFNMKITQAQFKQLGGFVGLVQEAEKTFGGGAEKLGQTATGMLSTITDNIHTFFRSAGDGILVALKPRLKYISEWFTTNEKDVNRWKDKLVEYGKQGAEYLLSSLEGTFKFIQTRYLDNPDFQKLDFQGKIDFVIEDLANAFQPTAEKVVQVAADMGTRMIQSAAESAMVAVTTSPLLALLLGAYIGLRTPGPVEVKIAVMIAIAMTPYVKQVIDWLSGIGGQAEITKRIDAQAALREKIANTPEGQSTISGGEINQGKMSWWDSVKYNYLDGGTGSSRASGLSYVPYDGYKATLHKGESIQTPEQTANGNGPSVSIAKLADQIVVREEADIDKFAGALAREIIVAGGLIG